MPRNGLKKRKDDLKIQFKNLSKKKLKELSRTKKIKFLPDQFLVGNTPVERKEKKKIFK